MKKENKLANSIPKETKKHPWRKMNNCLAAYSQNNLNKNKLSTHERIDLQPDNKRGL